MHAAIVVLSLLAVGTQPALGTKHIPGDLSIGTWDSGNSIYTLTTDVYETIQIDEDNLTLDGAGYTVTAGSSLDGVYVPTRTGVTIQNDGFVDSPYLIHDFWGNQNGQDDLPWTYEDRYQTFSFYRGKPCTRSGLPLNFPFYSG